MQEMRDEIREQLHEIRNLLGRSELKIADLGHQISQGKIRFEEGIASLKSQISSIQTCGRSDANTIRIDELTSKIEGFVEDHVQLSEKVRRIEVALKIRPNSDGATPLL
jgi:chromosome segregation ATPase